MFVIQCASEIKIKLFFSKVIAETCRQSHIQKYSIYIPKWRAGIFHSGSLFGGMWNNFETYNLPSFAIGHFKITVIVCAMQKEHNSPPNRMVNMVRVEFLGKCFSLNVSSEDDWHSCRGMWQQIKGQKFLFNQHFLGNYPNKKNV